MLADYPFDTHWVLASRRSRNQPIDRVRIGAASTAFSFPPHNFEWVIDSPGSIVCSLKTIASQVGPLRLSRSASSGPSGSAAVLGLRASCARAL